MKLGTHFREPARVVMHLNEGFTQIVLERCVNNGMAGDYALMEVPTERIPVHLRAISSRFLLIWTALHPETQDSETVIRVAMDQQFRVEELSGA